jgi:hypothetical protein
VLKISANRLRLLNELLWHVANVMQCSEAMESYLEKGLH